MRVSEDQIRRLAAAVIAALGRCGFVQLKAAEPALVERVTRLLVENLQTEQALEEEAERLAQRLGRQALGMDQRKIVQGIKERLAKEKGFQL